MKRLIQIFVIGALVALLTTSASAQVPQMMNYQGKLTTTAGAPVNATVQMVFSIYADEGGTNLLWTETQPAVTVDKGVFNVLLGSVSSIPYSVFDGSIRYLGVKVGGDPEITPRKPMVSVPYAYRASSGGGGSDDKWKFRITDTADTSITTRGNWGIARYGATLYGDMDSTHVNLGVSCTTGISTHSNKYCTVAGGLANTASESATTVGGGYRNIASGFIATIAGGDSNIASNNFATVGGGFRNSASGYSATVGGGEDNTASSWNAMVGGGQLNTASGSHATVGGGYYNTASGLFATVGGGYGNTASQDNATVGGGFYNTASGDSSTIGGGVWNTANSPYAMVGGGSHNTASGSNAAIPGGYGNVAAGDYSLAAGNLVTIGAGVDYTFAFGNNFITSASHAVIFHDTDTPIKVGIGTTSPSAALEVVGSGIADHLLLTNLTGPGAALRLNAVNKDWCIIGTNPLSSAGDQKLVFRDYTHAVDRMVIDSSGNVGIGTTTPQGALDVSSTTGALIVSRMTTVQRNALTAVNGMIIYNTTTNQFNFYEAGAWVTK